MFAAGLRHNSGTTPVGPDRTFSSWLCNFMSGSFEFVLKACGLQAVA